MAMPNYSVRRMKYYGGTMKEFLTENTDAQNLLMEGAVRVEMISAQGMRVVAAESLQNGCLAKIDAWLEQLELL